MALKSRMAAAVLGAGLALTVGVPGAGAADNYHPPVPNVVTLVSANSPHCLEVGGWSTDNGAPVQQWSCTTGANQNWRLANGPLVNAHTGKCLEIGGWSTDNGALAQQWDCNGGANQNWEWIRVKGAGYTLRNAWSGKCLDVPGGGYVNGVRMQQWDCWNGNNQQWFPTSAGDGPPPVEW
ncbi:RICIN domain-containing protein [Kitasatospora sp. NPDC056184]|uniref:RICIN domain-containing protein n=1 Tax=Kitasatospora sp. NPDC056184 TaxID=3345738 RepID=UPI0035E0BFC0